MRSTSTLLKPVLALLLAVACWLPVQSAEAQTSGGPFGLGVILGEPTGITAKLFLGGVENALDLHLTWDFTDDAFAIFSDYLFHFQPWSSPSTGLDLPMYVGIGGSVAFRKDVRVGARIPVGLAMHFQNAPVEIFLEIVPGLRLVPNTTFDLGGGIGVRYYF